MKVCPSCKTQYTDETLAFCLQDGTRLVSAESGPPTEVLPEIDTVVRRGEQASEVTRFRPTEETRVASPRAAKRSSRGPIVALIGLVLLVGFLVVAAVGAWLLFRHWSVVANNVNVNATPTPKSANIPVSSPTPTISPNRSPATNLNPTFPTPSPTQTVDATSVRRAVTDRISSWKSATESLDINSLMQNYAGTVDYYKRGPTSAAFVRNDKLRALSRFDSIQINVSNVNISTDATGEHAIAEFDKEWVFQGARVSRGKVRSQFRMTLINGRWLITGEKDLSVYYLN